MSRPTLPAHFRASSLATNPSASAHAPGHASHPSLGGSGGAYGGASSQQTQASPALLARIAEKKTELAHLRELRDSSAQLAGQMASLEAKLGTLSDGTAAVACVLGNWGSVLQAISLASSKIPQPKNEDGEERVQGEDGLPEGEVPLPQTLVRIPVQQADETARAAAAAVAKESGD